MTGSSNNQQNLLHLSLTEVIATCWAHPRRRRGTPYRATRRRRGEPHSFAKRVLLSSVAKCRHFCYRTPCFYFSYPPTRKKDTLSYTKHSFFPIELI